MLFILEPESSLVISIKELFSCACLQTSFHLEYQYFLYILRLHQHKTPAQKYQLHIITDFETTPTLRIFKTPAQVAKYLVVDNNWQQWQTLCRSLQTPPGS